MTVPVERDNIGIFGKMNAGKSSVMNLLTQQETSIVDATPGTTSDTKISLHEIHGIGPVRIFDTAGINEHSGLGEKKRKKVMRDLRETNLVLLVIDPSTSDFNAEEGLLKEARELDRQIIVIYNVFKDEDRSLIHEVEEKLTLLRFHKKIIIKANDAICRKLLLDFILENYEPENPAIDLLPFIERNRYYILVIPMDVETPPGRYLRPQAMTEEYITRHWAYPVSFRLDLAAARGDDSEAEKRRFLSLINGLAEKPSCIITDSQAMDIMSRWCPEEIELTTFSIVMINYMSGGKLSHFAKGAEAIDKLKSGDSILIAEACNHSRIGEDIGTVQIPAVIEKKYPGVKIEHNFGREFQENSALEKYSLIIHCGGCMISRQKMTARIRDLDAVGVPYTNYGIFLSAVNGPEALRKVLKPWGIFISTDSVSGYQL
jgi:[FeFe] hydrogenase H-cluster maturation GTPase HydF